MALAAVVPHGADLVGLSAAVTPLEELCDGSPSGRAPPSPGAFALDSDDVGRSRSLSAGRFFFSPRVAHAPTAATHGSAARRGGFGCSGPRRLRPQEGRGRALLRSARAALCTVAAQPHKFAFRFDLVPRHPSPARNTRECPSHRLACLVHLLPVSGRGMTVQVVRQGGRILAAALPPVPSRSQLQGAACRHGLAVR